MPEQWIDGHRRNGRAYPPVIREETTGDEKASWGESVATALLAQSRTKGVSRQRLRPAVQALRAVPAEVIAQGFRAGDCVA